VKDKFLLWLEQYILNSDWLYFTSAFYWARNRERIRQKQEYEVRKAKDKTKLDSSVKTILDHYNETGKSPKVIMDYGTRLEAFYEE